MLARLRARLKKPQSEKPSENETYRARLERREYFLGLIALALPYIRFLLYAIGYSWMILIPFEHLGSGVWVDENALQPAQVSTYWDWSDVHAADLYLGSLEDLRNRNASSIEKAAFIRDEFSKLGLQSSIQPYEITASTKNVEGVNAYGSYAAPRSSGAEAMVLSASWLSRTGEGDGTANLRGIATVMALARYLTRYSVWAKDLVFVVSDGYMDGMHAWLSSYHGLEDPSIKTEPLVINTGVVWTALCIDYPGHSFSHLGFFYEGLNGRLPNQDLLNSAARIASWTGGVPVVIYDHIDYSQPIKQPWFLPFIPSTLLNHHLAKKYAYHAQNVARHVSYQGLNRASGIHGLFHRYRIDAITLFAVPSYGPHGFHAIGRIIESTLRTMNNLLERLHASFFFYILTSVNSFVKFGGYLASAILVSVSMIFGGLRLWVVAGWLKQEGENEQEKGVEKNQVISSGKWTARERPVLIVLAMMLATHFIGWLTLLMVNSKSFASHLEAKSPTLSVALGSILATSPLVVFHPQLREYLSPHKRKHSTPTAPLYLILKAFNLYLSSIVISLTSVLNFSLAASLAVLLGLPLSLVSPSSLTKYVLILLITPMGLVGLASQYLGVEAVMSLFARTVWEWDVLGVWFLPFACVVFLPITLQALLVCALPA